jgi:DNA (cytosine-5)-methyltransferase 1
MDLGLSAAGFDIRVAVETDPAACETLKANWPGITKRLVQKRIEDVPTSELLRIARLKVGQVGLVFGGPPCQSWCVAGNRLGLADPRGRSILEFCRVVRQAAPEVFCLENVPGLLNHHATDVLRLIEEEVNRDPTWSYQVEAQVLNTAAYGVPQLRRRVFVVGWRTGGEFYFPQATHAIRGYPHRPWLKSAVGVGKAFIGLPPPDAPSFIARRVAKTIPQRNRKWYGKE